MNISSIVREVNRRVQMAPTSASAQEVRVVERYTTEYLGGDDEPRHSGLGRSWRHGYRALSTPSIVEADVDWWETAVRAEQAWRRNPLARRLVDLTHSMVLSRDVAVTASDNPTALAKDDPQWEDHDPGSPRWTVEEILTEFWENNDLALRMWDYELALRVRGMEFIPAFVRQSDGRVLLGVNPGRIIDVVEDPEDITYVIGVSLAVDPLVDASAKSYCMINRHFDGDYAGKTLGLIKYPGETGAGTDVEGREWDGQGFLFRINRMPDYKFGWSDLLSVLDHLEQGDDFFFDILDRVYWLSAVVWKWSFEGAQWADLGPGGKYYEFVLQNPPKQGSNLLLNEKVNVEPQTPNFSAAEMSEYAQLIATIVGAFGFGIPPAWLGFGEGANRSIALEQGTPTRRLLEAYQTLAAGRWKKVCNFVLDQAILAGRLPDRTSRVGRQIDWGVELQLPALDVRDTATLARVLSITTQAVVALTQAGLPFDQTTYVDIVSFALRELGVEPTLAEET